MKLGITYSMESTVVEFEENRRIAWQTRGSGRIGSFVSGQIWRYELEPVEGGTGPRELGHLRGKSEGDDPPGTHEDPQVDGGTRSRASKSS